MKRLLQAIGLLFILGMALPSFSQGSFKSLVDSSCAAGASTTCDANAAMNVAAGDLVVAFSGSGDTGNNTVPTITSVACTTGTANSMTVSSTAASTSGSPGKMTMAFLANTGANATCTWRATGASQAFRTLQVVNYGNMATASVLDQGPVCNSGTCNAGTTGATTRTTTNTGTTTQANEVGVCGTYEDNTSTPSAGSGFTRRDGAGASDHFVADSILSSTGIFPNGNFLTGAVSTVNYVALCATFKANAPAGGAPAVNKRAKLEKMYAALKLKVSGMGAITAAITPLEQLAGVFTWRADVTHQSADTAQTILTTSNVTGSSFKKVWHFATADADIKTQPLVVANLRFPDKVRNVTYIASMGNTAYALDADSGQLLWKTDLNAGESPANATDVMSCNDVIGTVGVISTGAIDPATKTIYYLAKTEVAGPAFKYRLHALDIATGAEKFGGPTLVTATVAGTGAGSSGGFISLDPHHNNNTSGAVIANSLLYLTFSSHCDDVPYHGWILAYDLKTLQQKYVWANAPNSGTGTSKEGGPWMSGSPPAIDENGNLYVTVGCADFNGTDALGQSTIKLSPQLTVLSFFTPFNWSTMNTNDYDQGASGVTLLPDQATGPPRLIVHGGKSHNLYVENRDNLGGNHASDNNQIVQYLSATFSGTDFGDNGMFSTPLYWNGKLYFCIADTTTPQGCQMRTLTNGSVASSASSTTPEVCHIRTCGGYITSTGSTNGIFWMYDNDTVAGKAHLYAYDATNLATKLYDSEANAARDSCPMGGSKWMNPTVYNGKVYIVGTTGICAYANF